MASFAFKFTKLTLDVVTRLIRADVRMHNVQAVPSEAAIIFVVNHFTRLETFLLPYQIYKQTGMEAWSLASGDLFIGKIGAYLRSLGTVSTKDPHRDRIIIRTLLTGDHPWIIFPEGGMIKDKKLVDPKGMFEVFYRGGRRPPHTGAAVLALRTEYYRHKIECLAQEPGAPRLAEGLKRFDLQPDDYDRVARHRLVIIPVNITYFPIRAHKNLLLNVARGLARNLTPRAEEELAVEGSIIARQSDVDITLGDPIDARPYLERPGFEELMACGEADLERLEENPRSPFNEVARQLMLRYMTEIYRLTTINHDHIFATLIRHQRAEEFTERAYRNRIFLSARRILELGTHPVHDLLRHHYREILYEEPSEKFNDFLDLCLRERILAREGNVYRRLVNGRRPKAEFHVVRQRELAQVIANEIEPLADVTALIREVAQAPRPEISQTIRRMFLKEDLELFEKDYEATFDPKVSKPPEVGRPFLLLPKRFKAGVVLVHGYLAAPLEVRRMAEFLSERGYAVYGVRLKGHGTTPEDLAQTPWEAWYESFNRGYVIIKTLTDRIILGGFSTGGAMALLGAGRKGRKVEAVFSISAPLELRHYAAHLATPAAAAGRLIRRLRGSRRWQYLRNMAENADINYASNPVRGVRELNAAMDAMERALKDVQSPTLILQGSRDPVVDPDSARLIFSQVGTTDKLLTILERDRHGIVNGPDADEVFNHVLHFLAWAEQRHQYGWD